MSLLFPGRNLKTFRRFLDPHFSPTEVYVVSVNLETDLVPRSRFDGSRTKKGEGGGGEGVEETRSGKIRLRGPESGPRVNCACSKSDLFSSVQSVQTSFDTALCFAF